ncbi:MAG: F0F1 ATP synthase subunit A [Verrucomicrobiae bacterium]|nr:F0F1 ATP synthase subunit A [Verrucomicrobiae bacterium]
MPVEHAHEGLTQYAPVLFNIGPLPVTNSMLAAWAVTLCILFVVRAAAGKISLVPHAMQNFLEFVIETLYETLDGILGAHLVRKTFWFFATVFLFILFGNWLGLLPFFGNLTVVPAVSEGHEAAGRVGLLRGANADLNMTLALATVYGVVWLYWAVREVGVWGILKEIFGVKGGLTGLMKWILFPIFFLVGIIEVISILFRQVSLPLRLYGNIFAGENLLEVMTSMGVNAQGILFKAVGVLLPFPFYCLEILVGFVQAFVFMLLTAVFTATMCKHEEESH